MNRNTKTNRVALPANPYMALLIIVTTRIVTNRRTRKPGNGGCAVREHPTMEPRIVTIVTSPYRVSRFDSRFGKPARTATKNQPLPDKTDSVNVQDQLISNQQV